MSIRPFGLGVCCLLLLAPCFAQSAHLSAQASSKPKARQTAPDPGTVANGTYRNAFFAFSYKLPFGWVERTAQMQEGSEPGKSQLLLAVFERPPEAAGDAVNSAVIIAAESVDLYPGLKYPADYFGPLTEVTAGKGFKAVNEPYEVSVGGKELVRGDFTKEATALSMYQASLVALEKGYVLSFTFLGVDEDDVDQVIDGLRFVAVGKTAKPKAPVKP
ncbi:MAG TPA: hypothetical protein VMT28_02100 [Terriglobales bacterium]|nr:hypothetical protein [Terriglobales bacterium]